MVSKLLKRLSTKSGKIDKEGFLKFADKMDISLSERELTSAFASLDRRDTGAVSVSSILDLYTEESPRDREADKKQRSSERRSKSAGRTKRRSDDDSSAGSQVDSDTDECTLLPSSMMTELKEATVTHLRTGDRSIWKLLTSVDEDKMSKLSRRHLRKFLTSLGATLTESNTVMLYECFEFETTSTGNGVGASIQDILLFLMSLLSTDGELEAAIVCRNCFCKKKITPKDLLKALMKYDQKGYGYITCDSMDRVLKKLCGSGISSNDISKLEAYLDPERDDKVDIGHLSSLLHVCSDITRARTKLRHVLKLMRLKEKDYREVVMDASDGTGFLSEDEYLDVFMKMSLTMTRCELQLAAASVTKKGKVDVKTLLDTLENEDHVAEGKGDGKGIGRGWSTEGLSNNFGKSVFQKLCKLRSNREKRDAFRRVILGRDADCTGTVAKKELQRALDGVTDLSEAEISLLVENLSVGEGSSASHGNSKAMVDYPLLLLLLMEPIQHVPIEAGATVAEVLLEEDQEGLKRQRASLRKLYGSLSGADRRVTGLTPIELAIDVFKEECPDVDKKTLKSLLRPFQESSSDTLNYPELVSFIACSSLDYCMNMIRHIDSIRKKQGYQFGESLVKYTSKKGKKLDRVKALELFRHMGMLLPDAALDTILDHYQSSDGTLNASKFATALSHEKKSLKKDRIKADPLNLEKTAKCLITEKILREYDDRLTRAVYAAFDEFAVEDLNEIPAEDLERVLCALGHNPVADDVKKLVDAVDPRGKGTLPFNDFLRNVIPYLREMYSLSHISSKDVVKRLFDSLDADADGVISREEFNYVLVRAFLTESYHRD